MFALKVYWVSSNPHVIKLIETMLLRRGFKRADVQRQPLTAAAAGRGSEGDPADGLLAEAAEEGQPAGRSRRTAEAVFLQGPARTKAVCQDA